MPEAAPPLSLPSLAIKTRGLETVASKNGGSFQPLAVDLDFGSFHYRQLTRQNDVAIYEQSKNRRVFSFEVVRIRRMPPIEIKGSVYPEREVYPRSEDWGADGFTCCTLTEAHARLHRLQKEEVSAV